jgi:uncharacterized coiled-coil protein SlyX
LKLVTRAQWGARAYRTPNGATPYSRARRGVKLHYLGTPYADRPHEQCAAYVRQLQAQHMDGNGWSDVGYSFLVCTHGYVYEGRGLTRRNSANGSTALNEQDYAVCLLVGSAGLTEPTDAQLTGARDAIDYCREEGPAGTWLGGHRDGYATTCPGDAVYAWAKQGAPRPDSKEDPMAGMTNADICAAVWETDGVVGVPEGWGAAGNTEWKASSILIDLGKRVRGLEATAAAQAATIDKLVDAVAAGPGADLDALKAEIRAAIESVTIRIDTTPEG